MREQPVAVLVSRINRKLPGVSSAYYEIPGTLLESAPGKLFILEKFHNSAAIEL